MGVDVSGKPEVTVIAHDIGPVGGMERQLSQLIGGLLDAGHQVTVISRTCKLPEHKGMHWIRVPGPARPFAIAYPWFFLLGSILVWLRGRGVVHSTGALVFNRTPVATVHFCHRAVANLPGFSRASKPGLAYRLNALVGPPISRLAERWCYRPGRVERLVAVSGGVAEELRNHFPKMKDRVAMIPNGVDTETFHPAEDSGGNGSAEKVEAIFVGSEWERKGLNFAIEALRDNPASALTVVGEGDEDAYQRLASSLGVGERVHFAGRSTDVASWYRRADLFVLPTSYEAAPLVTYEAAASGLPLLVTKVNGVEDLLEDGVNGWFIDRDPEDIGERFRALSTDPELRASMGRAARKDSLEYSWSRVVERYRELYSEVSG